MILDLVRSEFTQSFNISLFKSVSFRRADYSDFERELEPDFKSALQLCQSCRETKVNGISIMIAQFPSPRLEAIVVPRSVQRSRI